MADGHVELVRVTDGVGVSVALVAVHGEAHRLPHRLGFCPAPFHLEVRMEGLERTRDLILTFGAAKLKTILKINQVMIFSRTLGSTWYHTNTCGK